MSKQTTPDSNSPILDDAKVGAESSTATTQYYLKGLGFLLIPMIVQIVMALIYIRAHGINLFELLQQPGNPIIFDFVGGRLNVFSIAVEILFWTLGGVNAQMAYSATRAILGKQFVFWIYLIRWYGTLGISMGIATALILSLQVITINVANIEITLKNASIEIIVAIAFILGFYNEYARALLNKLLRQVAPGLENKSKQQDRDIS